MPHYAARRNDGWMHGGGTGDLDELLAKLQRYRDEEGTADKDFQIHVISIDAYTPDGIKRLEDKGVTDVIIGFRIPYITGPDTEPLDAKIRNLEMFAEHVIAKVN